MSTRELPVSSAGNATAGRSAVAGSSPAGSVAREAPRLPAGIVTGPQRGTQARTALAAAMSENELERHVRRLIDGLGLLGYHVRDSRRSVKGFPDFVICGRRILYRELKTAKGRVTGEQRQWLHALTVAGADAGLWRPEDLTSGVIARELAAISKLGWRAA